MSNAAKNSSTRSAKRGKVSVSKTAGAVVRERRIATPRADLVVLKIGGADRKAKTSSNESTADILAKLGRAISKPGIDRALVFGNDPNSNVYAYSIDLEDTTRLVREDASGKKTIGRFIGGRFRAMTAGR